MRDGKFQIRGCSKDYGFRQSDPEIIGLFHSNTVCLTLTGSIEIMPLLQQRKASRYLHRSIYQPFEVPRQLESELQPIPWGQCSLSQKSCSLKPSKGYEAGRHRYVMLGWFYNEHSIFQLRTVDFDPGRYKRKCSLASRQLQVNTGRAIVVATRNSLDCIVACR